ncbi:hypothetical protein DYB32_006054 [Aphanomyces invadans]|uniref:Uncharacterized protein n=1 Tax=Aphanomyces invadans TaxID=157072 RepID=A0A3R6VLZ8_9STRA|nr:hypothetical protein DYB32_006054 [Aphanomyces invadans]
MEESSDTWDRRMAACFSGPGLEKIKACFGSDESKRYLHDYVAVTSTMDTPWMPYVSETISVAQTTTLAVSTAAVPVQTTLQVVKAKEKKPVMPCRQKEKGFVYEDPPGIGVPVTGGTPSEARAAGGVATPIKLSSSTPSSFITNPLLLPVLLIGGLLYAALRYYSKPDKKDV